MTTAQHRCQEQAHNDRIGFYTCNRPAKGKVAQPGGPYVCGIHARSAEAWGAGVDPINGVAIGARDA